jgi:hypothetical protein
LNTIPEQPVGPPPAPPPISAPSPRAPVWSLAVALVGVFLIFFCALLWLTIAHPTRPAPNSRNRPELLLLGNSFNGLTNLPEVTELTTNLSNDDIAFGETQMGQMIKDRPEFARYVSKDDDVWQFCVRAFAGAAIGEHIIWNNSLLENERYLADHLGPYDGHPGYIQIRKNVASGDRRGRPLTCEELWSCAVFELENIRSHRAFLALYYRALDGKLSREEWIRGCSRLEY